MMSYRLLVAVALSIALGAPGFAAPAVQPPATQGLSPATSLRDADLRVASVAFRVARDGVALCQVHEPLTGIAFHYLPEYRIADQPGMMTRYGLERGPGVLAVVADSPAAKAGLVAGDVLLSVNGKKLQKPPSGNPPAPSGGGLASTGDGPTSWRSATDASEDQIDAALRDGAAELDVLRAGQEVKARLEPLSGCFGRVRLAYSKQVNAFSNAHGVVMTTSMLAFIRSDDELAIVLGHELAHRILGHPIMSDSEGVLASFGIKAGELWRREAEADRLGLRLAAAAGYDLSAAIPFWRRYLGKYDWYPQLFRSHPSLKAREKIVREEVDAIARARAR
jgi:hypothetical protein